VRRGSQLSKERRNPPAFGARGPGVVVRCQYGRHPASVSASSVGVVIQHWRWCPRPALALASGGGVGVRRWHWCCRLLLVVVVGASSEGCGVAAVLRCRICRHCRCWWWAVGGCDVAPLPLSLWGRLLSLFLCQHHHLPPRAVAHGLGGGASSVGWRLDDCVAKERHC
jgi:hypothetical protein